MSSTPLEDHDPRRIPTTLRWFPIFLIRLKWSTTERSTSGCTTTFSSALSAACGGAGVDVDAGEGSTAAAIVGGTEFRRGFESGRGGTVVGKSRRRRVCIFKRRQVEFSVLAFAFPALLLCFCFFPPQLHMKQAGNDNAKRNRLTQL